MGRITNNLQSGGGRIVKVLNQQQDQERKARLASPYKTESSFTTPTFPYEKETTNELHQR